REQHSGGAVEAMGLIGSMLVAEPKGKPLPAVSLCPRKVSHTVFNCSKDTPVQIRWQICQPAMPGAQCMRCQVRCAAVEGQIRPAAAECWQASVRVLQVQKPMDAGDGRRARAFVKHTVLPIFLRKLCCASAGGMRAPQ